MSSDDIRDRPIANFAHLAGNYHQALDEGRRRQSSNFFEILNDPQRYRELVYKDVNENFNDDEEESKDLASPTI